MSIPVIYSVCRAYPGIGFTMLTSPTAAALFLEMPDNLTVIPVYTRGRHAGLKGIFTLYKELRRPAFDAVADLHDVLRSQLLRGLFRLSGVRTAHIDKGRREKRRLISGREHRRAPLTPTVDRYAAVFRRLGLPFDNRFTTLFARPPLQPAKIQLPEDKPLIGIAPFARHKGKIYPPEYMRQVIAGLSSTGAFQLLLFGGQGEEARQLAQWEQQYSHTLSLAGQKLGLAAELAIISRLSVMVSMDSANMHLASLTGIPVISVWGATHPWAGFMGWNQTESRAVGIDLPCRPCSIFGNKPCRRKDYACLYGIAPQIIIEKVKSEIQHQKQDGIVP